MASAPLGGDGLPGRFLRLVGATGVEGALGTLFLLSLAWRDSDLYGSLMYGLAAAAILHKVVQLGLYYPLVSALGGIPRGEAWRLLAPVAALRMALASASLGVLGLFVLWRDVPAATALSALAIGAGFALEAVASTAFAELRLAGQQQREARLRCGAALLAYAYGFVSVAAGAPAPVIALFKPLGAAVLVVGAWRSLGSPRGALGPPGASWRTLRPLVAAALVLGGVDILGTFYNKTNIFFLEGALGTHAVALYGATWNVVDAVSLLVSEQYLAGVVFPTLAVLWVVDRPRALTLVREQGLWLFLVACAVMFVLHQGSAPIIALLYPTSFAPAAALQHWLVPTIALSFVNNLGAALMIVAGSAPQLLGFAVLTTVVNLALNAWLIPWLGLTGACLVIVLTKLVMTALTTVYCQRRFGLFAWSDVVWAVGPPTLALILHALLLAYVPRPVAAALALAGYTALAAKAWRRVGRGRPVGAA